ncbi:hypothetical protein LTR62_004573 [Meristemomyces frigidus]|uniref:Zn(2)-C6 fungal-type domain-containing protein n=1 Tax=Meristemomyces frigidus TaxID=1508187 RepID=A0AAN7YG15_9PEZI|nr:hypothetical protein LTR62_004573 [Meristemomyces frigidus]
MLPAVQSDVLAANPKFATLYKDLVTNRLQDNGASKLDAKAQQERDQLQKLRNLVLLTAATLGGKISSADSELVNEELTRVCDNATAITTQLAAQLAEDLSTLAIIAEPDEASISRLPKFIASLVSMSQSQQAVLSQCRFSLAQEVQDLQDVYREALEASIRVLEQTIHGSVARHTKVKAEYLAVVAEDIGKKLGVQEAQLLQQAYDASTQSAIKAALQIIRTETILAKQQTRELDEKLDQYRSARGMDAMPLTFSNRMSSWQALASNANPAGSPLPRLGSVERSNKRVKVTRACDRCKRRKRRCNGEAPCHVCLSIRVTCTYDSAYTRGKLVGPSTPTAPRLLPTREPQVLVSRAPTPGPDAVNHDRTGGIAVDNAESGTALAFLARARARFGLRVDHDTNNELSPDWQGVHRSSIFSYGDRPASSSSPAPAILPLASHAKSLFALYFDFAMPTYRFLHQQTAMGWLENMLLAQNGMTVAVSPAQRVIVWIVLATAILFSRPSRDPRNLHADWDQHNDDERYFANARQILATETGKVTLESVQARLAMCLYLLNSSRPNEGWYVLGIAVQLSYAMGLHRRSRDTPAPIVDSECKKRTMWAIVTLDTYMSTMLGRPNLVHDEDISQEYPQSIDDDELQEGQRALVVIDRVIEAFICHIKLARVVKRAAHSQALPSQARPDSGFDDNIVDEIAAWQAQLPAVLSGIVQPSSLITIFRRQSMVLRLGHAHAVMLVTRSLLFHNSPFKSEFLAPLRRCLEAAVTTLDIVNTWSDEATTFAAFWLTQYVTFNAISIIYVYAIQTQRGLVKELESYFPPDDLTRRAALVQQHFVEVAELNAPSLRYNAVLEELQREAQLVSSVVGRSQTPSSQTAPFAMPLPDLELSLPSEGLDFWLQLDSFPFCENGELGTEM